MLYNSFLSVPLYDYLGSFFSFGFPGNDNMFTLITLFSELFFIGSAIIYLLFEVFSILINEFSFDRKRIPSNFSPELESFLDIFFLLFPTAIVIFILVPTLGFIYSEELISDSNFTITISITGHQWYWTYKYFVIDNNQALELILNNNSDIEFDAILLTEHEKYRLLATDNTVFFPSSTRVLLQITSDDVIHSWSIPQLGIKVDAIPGRLATVLLYSDIEATWYGQCSELCGSYHAFMPISLTSVSPECFFAIWVQPSVIFSIYKI